MLNPFPELLYLRLLAPTILRWASGLTFAYIVYAQFTRRHELVRQFGVWFWLLLLAESLPAVGLIFGYHTQYAALLGIAVSLVHMYYAKRYPHLIPLCRLDYFYLMVICVSLLLTGAGAFAYDISL